MIIQIQNEIIKMENDTPNTEEIFEIINDILKKNDLEFDYLIIDNQAVYDNFSVFFAENLSLIEKVVVIVKAAKKIVQDTIISTDQYLTRAIPEVNALAEEFYQHPNEKTWIKLVDLFEGVQWIIETVVRIDGVKGLDTIIMHYTIWNEYVQAVSELSSVIKELEIAMISKDHVLIGDLLIYEVNTVFKKMQASLKLLIRKGEKENVS